MSRVKDHVNILPSVASHANMPSPRRWRNHRKSDEDQSGGAALHSPMMRSTHTGSIECGQCGQRSVAHPGRLK
jgi:hypothetical protein